MQTWIIEQSRSLRAAFETLSTDLGRVRQPEGEGATRTTVQNVFQAALTYVAGADGPINEQEGYILHTIFQNDNGRGTYEYIRQNVYKDLSLVSDIESLLGAFVRNLADDLREQGEEYDAASDAVIDFLSDMGELLIAADQDISVEETRALAEIVSPLRAFATQIEDGVVEPSEADLEADNEDDIDEDDGGEIAPFEPTVKLDPLTRLHNLIGLAEVKVEVETLGNLARVFAMRKERGLPVPDISFHLAFTGGPGTGKTTVARIIAEVYGKLGLLSRGHLIEVDRSGLVANFVGQTATKTRNALKSAMGGVLFIDEAYALAKGGDQDFGSEAIETILKTMEDSRDDLVVIVAGYDEQMRDFLSSNPGLKSRFSKTINFPDYSPQEMVEIFDLLASQVQYQISNEAKSKLLPLMTHIWTERDATFANARDVRTIFERAVSNHARRISSLADITVNDLSTFSAQDIPS